MSDGAQLIRAKVWQPSGADAERDAQQSTQVTRFKFFGREATGDSAAVAKNLVFAPPGQAGAKSAGSGSTLNGVLFAACQADETAAAGSRTTDNLSAFTFAVLREIDGPVSVGDLAERATERLRAISMRQTPRAIAPPAEPGLLDREFVSLRPLAGPAPEPDEEFDPWEWLQSQLSGVL